MNYLVYRGLIHPKYKGVPEVQTARRRLAKASQQLLLGEWLTHHHVHENYNAATGEGNDVSNSNPFCAQATNQSTIPLLYRARCVHQACLYTPRLLRMQDHIGAHRCPAVHIDHWGALTGLIGLMEDGLWDREKPGGGL